MSIAVFDKAMPILPHSKKLLTLLNTKCNLILTLELLPTIIGKNVYEILK